MNVLLWMLSIDYFIFYFYFRIRKIEKKQKQIENMILYCIKNEESEND